MSMNGIDVSNWQKGIDLSAVPADFVIVKATQGTWYLSGECDRQYQQAKKAGRCLGVYHYAEGGDHNAEADYFLKNIRGYIGEAVLALDWEAQNNRLFNTVKDNAWIKNWCDYVYAQTGVKPMVYLQASTLSRVSGIGDYGLWVAQYADNSTTGYQDKPWNEGAYTCAIRQYSSAGRLSGYSGNLDLNKFYGDRAAWKKYVKKADAAQPDSGNPASGSRVSAGAGNAASGSGGTGASGSSKIVIDGLWGRETTSKAQRVFKTTVDGIVSNQWALYQPKNPGLVTGWDWHTRPDGKGSQLIRAMQRWCGMRNRDGEIGPNTIMAMQKKLGCSIVDGVVSRPSGMVTALQTWLNRQ